MRLRKKFLKIFVFGLLTLPNSSPLTEDVKKKINIYSIFAFQNLNPLSSKYDFSSHSIWQFKMFSMLFDNFYNSSKY